MARMRMLHPEFFTHEVLGEMSAMHRLLFAGLWTLADREGRLEDRPKRIKLALLPYDECDVDALLGDLAHAGFLVRYEAGAHRYITIPSFLRWQKPHIKEKPSEIPGVHKSPEITGLSTTQVGASTGKFSASTPVSKSVSKSESESESVSESVTDPGTCLPADRSNSGLALVRDEGDDEPVDELRRLLCEQLAITRPPPIAKPDPGDPEKITRTRGKLNDAVRLLGIDAALKKCIELAGECRKNHRGRNPSVMAYFVGGLEDLAHAAGPAPPVFREFLGYDDNGKVLLGGPTVARL